VSELQERESVAYDVTRRFTEVVRLERLGDLARQQVADARWLDEQARKLYEVGQVLESERGLAALHLDESEILERMRAAEADTARAALWLAIAGGEPSETAISVAAESLPEFGAVGAEEEEALSSFGAARPRAAPEHGGSGFLASAGAHRQRSRRARTSEPTLAATSTRTR
jgi:outer membrane protein TolC